MYKRQQDELSVKTDSVDKIINLLSGGNQQKIVISKWLRSDMKILLLDEPTAGVDIGAKRELIATVRKFTDEGNAAVFVSSELQEMLSICDRIYICLLYTSRYELMMGNLVSAR